MHGEFPSYDPHGRSAGVLSRRAALSLQIKKPMRTQHCFSCDACVARQDHHSIWINGCVGTSAPLLRPRFLSASNRSRLFVFQAPGTTTTTSSSCSGSRCWEPGCSTAASCVSEPAAPPRSASAGRSFTPLPSPFQTGPAAARCHTPSRACGAPSPPWWAARPGCSASSSWPFITPAGRPPSCCCSCTR